ncbi:MAG: molybdopterin-dependent oxidoreductase [Candidatus Promineifilaceae bacterium]|nr:molybdopterin-dependent oxidoreductase [Candidatus Promineifilaceae bacterium]
MIKKLRLGTGLLVGGLLTSALTALFYLGRQAAGLPFVPFELFDWMARVLPGPLITFGIDLMIDTLRLLGISVVDTAKTAERAMAILQFVAGGAVAGAIFFALARWRQARPDWRVGLLAGAIFGLPAIIISLTMTGSEVNPIVILLWLGTLLLIWGATLGWAFTRLARAEAQAAAVSTPAADVPAEEEAPAAAEPVTATAETSTVEKLDRRQFLIRFGAATATITVVSGGLATVLASAEERRRQQAVEQAAAQATRQPGAPTPTPLPNANAEVMPVPGTRSEITPVEEHYQVFIQTEPTVIDGSEWVLPITGLVNNPLMLSIDDLRNNYERRDQFVTLSCISGRIGTSLISTTLWSGASVQEVLADVGVQDAARYLHITSGDGFYETVDLELINQDERIMFAYAWDDQPIPVDHGYPLRIWIPDRYGMKQPKWITGIEVIDEYREGYWVERSWDRVARVKSTSVIDTVAVDQIIEREGQRLVPVGGIAFAGDRGISKVEVRVDGGSWQEARLRQPLSGTTWVLWRYEWPFQEGDHTFEVRCYEGDGTLQILESSGARPDGATGIHSYEADL